MTTFQKVIKYLALAFAIFIIVNIVSAILVGIYGLSNIFSLNDKTQILEEKQIIANYENMNIENLDIKVAYTNLVIKTGEFLSIETNNSNIKCEQNSQNLKIEEKDSSWFSKNNDKELIIYIPEDFQFEKVKISAGAGKVYIETLSTDTISFELGAGKVEINNLNVLDKAKIEGGAGKLKINGTINNLDFDMGVGKTEFNASLLGNSKINAGIGSLDINLIGEKEDYKIKTSKGIGNIKIDGKDVSDNETYQNGENSIKIDGGIGSIVVNFE